MREIVRLPLRSYVFFYDICIRRERGERDKPEAGDTSASEYAMMKRTLTETKSKRAREKKNKKKKTRK